MNGYWQQYIPDEYWGYTSVSSPLPNDFDVGTYTIR